MGDMAQFYDYLFGALLLLRVPIRQAAGEREQAVVELEVGINVGRQGDPAGVAVVDLRHVIPEAGFEVAVEIGVFGGLV